MQLTLQLCHLADIWADNCNRSPATLGTKIANDSKIFDRLKDGSSCTINTFEKFLSFFRDGENWKDSVIPDSAVCLLDQLANISTTGAVTGGKDADLTDNRNGVAA